MLFTNREDSTDRRRFLQRAGATLAAPYLLTASRARGAAAPSDTVVGASIGLGGQGRWIASELGKSGRVAALVDVDEARFAKAADRLVSEGGDRPELYGDYRRVLDRKDIDVVTIATPDHWHTKIAVEAMQAGKDVYCEKPLTLTIDEGRTLCRVAEETGRVVQVGTQQRSSRGFLEAVALVRDGRIGDLRRVWVAINKAKSGGPFPTSDPPQSLDWDVWQGQTPAVPYIRQRCHYDFRWWYEYSGGKLTDWGAHHVDIAQWGAGLEGDSPVWVNPLRVEHPVPMQNGHPQDDSSYNTATSFTLECRFKNGVELRIQDEVNEPGIAKFPRGVLFEGSEGRLFVNRDRVSGTAYERMAENPLPDNALSDLYKGRTPTSHMKNFLECVRDRAEPVSDVFSHHRILTTCHLSNIALRLGRGVEWDPTEQRVVGDEQAQSMVAREQRAGYEIVA
ncbi:Gfo/Idh/MocA family oxidoreductase [Botrimarina sp.]|uniref:Gfo/Idh/MocA family protein n=1 Tax=Botrimarina sp. TaxID=2795802 RepID=UPI0032F02BF3